MQDNHWSLTRGNKGMRKQVVIGRFFLFVVDCLKNSQTDRQVAIPSPGSSRFKGLPKEKKSLVSGKNQLEPNLI